MTVSNTNLPKEFKLLETKTNLTNLDEHQLLLNSINAAFASNQEKKVAYYISSIKFEKNAPLMRSIFNIFSSKLS